MGKGGKAANLGFQILASEQTLAPFPPFLPYLREPHLQCPAYLQKQEVYEVMYERYHTHTSSVAPLHERANNALSLRHAHTHLTGLGSPFTTPPFAKGRIEKFDVAEIF